MTRAITNKYDLEERAAVFTENVIKLIKTIKITPVNRAIIDQLIRAATSIAANYCEADDAESKKISSTRSASAKKNHAKQSIGLECCLSPKMKDARRLVSSGMKLRN